MKGIALAIPALAMLAFAQQGGTEQRPVRHARTGQETEKARTWRGTLVDGTCARKMAAMGTSSEPASAERSATEPSAGAAHADAKAVSQGCPVTSSTKDFGLVTNDGRILKLNEAGDAKVASELKTNTRWNKAVNTKKPITASVRGSLEGDTLQVESVK